MMKVLIDECGADVNLAFGDGSTPAYIAAQQGHCDAISLLASRGADVNAARHTGETPLHAAVIGGHIPVIDLLLREYGARVDAENARKSQPIHTACFHGCGGVGVIDHLVRHGASVTAPGPLGCQPLHCAAQRGDTAIVRFLYRKFGVDVTARNNVGETAIHAAAAFGRTATVRVLVTECGVDVNLTNERGTTPLVYAVFHGYVGTVRCLVDELGADVNIVSNVGWSPLRTAITRNHTITRDATLSDAESDDEEDPVVKHRREAAYQPRIPAPTFTELDLHHAVVCHAGFTQEELTQIHNDHVRIIVPNSAASASGTAPLAPLASPAPHASRCAKFITWIYRGDGNVGGLRVKFDAAAAASDVLCAGCCATVSGVALGYIDPSCAGVGFVTRSLRAERVSRIRYTRGMGFAARALAVAIAEENAERADFLAALANVRASDSDDDDDDGDDVGRVVGRASRSIIRILFRSGRLDTLSMPIGVGAEGHRPRIITSVLSNVNLPNPRVTENAAAENAAVENTSAKNAAAESAAGETTASPVPRRGRSFRDRVDRTLWAMPTPAPALHRLRKINLCNNNLGDEGVVTVARFICSAPGLGVHALNLANNWAGDQGCVAISEALCWRSRELKARGYLVGESHGAAAITLVYSGNPASTVGISAFAKAISSRPSVIDTATLSAVVPPETLASTLYPSVRKAPLAEVALSKETALAIVMAANAKPAPAPVSGSKRSLPSSSPRDNPLRRLPVGLVRKIAQSTVRTHRRMLTVATELCGTGPNRLTTTNITIGKKPMFTTAALPLAYTCSSSAPTKKMKA